MDYRYDPYTGQPLRMPSRTWMDNNYPSRGIQPVTPAQTQQNAPPAAEQSNVIVTRVASYDEAKAIPTDFSGVLRLMLDWDHGCIYAKAVASNGVPVFKVYKYDPAYLVPEQALAAPKVAYAPLEEVERLRQEVASLREELAARQPVLKESAEKSSGKGAKA